MLKKNQPKRRNATSKRKKKVFSFKFDLPSLESWSRPLMLAGLMLGVVSAGFVTYNVFDDVFSFPIEAVEVKGQLNYQDKKELARVIQSHSENGYMNIDMESLKVSLESLPWVRHASIKRNINNDLEVDLKEEVVVAYWNKQGFITDLGELLMLEDRPVIEGLPVFEGKDHKAVLKAYEAIDQKLFSNMKPIRSLRVNERKTIRVELSTGTELVMSMEDLGSQLDRWNKIAFVQMRGQITQVKQADLRYSNGAAVSWRESVAQLDNRKSGDH